MMSTMSVCRHLFMSMHSCTHACLYKQMVHTQYMDGVHTRMHTHTPMHARTHTHTHFLQYTSFSACCEYNIVYLIQPVHIIKAY